MIHGVTGTNCKCPLQWTAQQSLMGGIYLTKTGYGCNFPTVECDNRTVRQPTSVWWIFTYPVLVIHSMELMKEMALLKV